MRKFVRSCLWIRNLDCRSPGLAVAWAMWFALGAAGAGEGEFDEEKNPKAKSAPLKRALWTTSKVRGRPDPPPPFRAANAFPKLKYNRALYVAQEPGAETLLVVELPGEISAMAMDERTDVRHTVLKLPGQELYSFRFDPQYPAKPLLYVFANSAIGSPDGKEIQNRILRYEVERGTFPKAKIETERTIIAWPSNGHNGGEMDFGPDGMLYISSGDGTTDSDRNQTGQDLSNLCSAILRIDVANPDDGREYSIPKDNPFAFKEGARPEIWAFGLRNPWRMSFDRQTGVLWIGDIGQDLWEMIHVGKRGANYGWSVFEGRHPFHSRKRLAMTPVEPPVIEHPHSECRSITGGLVYCGDKFPELSGRYLYGDYATGKIWAARQKSGKVESIEEIADTRRQILAFAEGSNGEIYFADYAGTIQRLERAEPEPVRDFPVKLSQTGIYADVAALQVEPGLIPYEVNSPLWSDGAEKIRHIGLPGDAKIDFHETESWQFPHGTVLVKTFTLPTPTAEGSKPRRIETRLMVNDRNEWYGYSYRWNDDQTDAELAPKEGADAEYEVVAAAGEFKGAGVKKISRQTWRFPSRTECLVCHSRAAKFVLGLSTPQLNRPWAANARPVSPAHSNQLAWLEAVGAFKQEKLPKSVEDLGKLASPDDANANLVERVRSYLHTNCSICHIEAGGGNSAIELSYKTPLDQTRMIDVRPIHESFGIDDAKIVASGDPGRSVLLRRMANRGRGQMPPLSSSLVDQQAVEMISKWIRDLPARDDGARKISAPGGGM